MENGDKTKDAHIRIETYEKVGTNIYVDIFDSVIEEPHRGHIVSEMFQWGDEGADEATRFLQKHGFHVVVMVK